MKFEVQLTPRRSSFDEFGLFGLRHIVHAQHCSPAIDADVARRADPASYPAGTTLRPATVQVMSKDSPGKLATLAADATSALTTFAVMVRDAEQLRAGVGRLRTVRGMLAVERS